MKRIIVSPFLHCASSTTRAKDARAPETQPDVASVPIPAGTNLPVQTSWIGNTFGGADNKWVQVAALHQRVAGGESKAQVARELGISRETLYQYLRKN